jgi:hypothetical protein
MSEQANSDCIAEKTARLRRVIEHADESVSKWSVEKRRDASLTFYSRSSEATRGNSDSRGSTKAENIHRTLR